MLTGNEKKAVNELKKVLQAHYGLVELRLFGSKARGDFDRDSDLDIFIVVEESDWQIQMKIFELCFELSLQYEVVLSPIVYSVRELESQLIKHRPFYKTVIAEGVAL